MDTPFQFADYVTGKYFIGRRSDCITLSNLLSQGESIAIWSPLKSGKMSAVQQTLLNMRTSGKQFLMCSLDLTNIHDAELFIRRFAGAVISSVSTVPQDYEDNASKYLAGTSLEFDAQSFSVTGRVFSDNAPIGAAEISAVAELPFRIAEEKNVQFIIVLNEFENIDSDEGEKFFRVLDASISARIQARTPRCSFIFLGSRANAMESIFMRRKFFWKSVEKYSLSMISDAEIAEHVLKGFSVGGKVIERDLIQVVCGLFRNNIWYINNFFFICDALSKGYISEITFNDALSCMVSANLPRFKAIMDDLTGFQERFLKAVLDGNVKFSTTEVIENYRLNSSANVKRLKEALMKKEVLSFNDKDEPSVQDPLFEYWLRKYYFGEDLQKFFKQC